MLSTDLVYKTKGMRHRRFRQLRHFSGIGDASRTNDCDSSFFSTTGYADCTENDDVFSPYGGGKILQKSRFRRKRRDHLRCQQYNLIEMEPSPTNTLASADIPNVNVRIRNVLDRVHYEIHKLKSE